MQVDERRPPDRLPREADATCRPGAGASRRWASTSSTCDVLVPALEEDARDATQPRLRQGHHPVADLVKVPVYAYRFYDENKKAAKYWRDIGTLDAYYEANMDLCHVNPEFNLYDPEWPIRTHQVQAPPAKFVFADAGRPRRRALDSMISAGCIISGSTHPRQRALPQRARAQLLHRRAEHPDAGRARRPPRAHPPRHRRSRRLHSARRAASASTKRKTGSATPSPIAASSSSPRKTSRSSAPSATRRLRNEAEFDAARLGQEHRICSIRGWRRAL